MAPFQPLELVAQPGRALEILASVGKEMKII